STLYSAAPSNISDDPIVVETPAVTGAGKERACHRPERRMLLQGRPTVHRKRAAAVPDVGQDWKGKLPSGFPRHRDLRASSNSFTLAVRVR
ncbi:DUF1254 domain-containing protein, partial [Rhodococcus hoagii]|nr:DUF1254 domain-containing protein [Prescottella equi]